MRAPQIGTRRKKDSRVAPIMATPRKSKAAEAPRMTNWQVRTKQDIWQIGSGPWFWNGGQPASRPEYIVLITLKRLGWNPSFQTRVFGGRRLPAGQVLDIILEEVSPPIYINVKSYYHEGAEAAYNDKMKELLALGAYPGAKVLEIWEKDLDQPNYLEDLLVREIGARA